MTLERVARIPHTIHDVLRIAVAFAVAVVVPGCERSIAPANQSFDEVMLARTPHGGIQPQAVVDSTGTVHLIYFSGPADAGDVFYVRQRSGEPSYSSPIRVNSQGGSAIAVGTVRGAHLAIGREGRIHVAWNGSGKAEPAGPGGTPMLYARLNDSGTAFDRQRNLITWAGGIDGGGTVAADTGGTVYVAWHSGGQGTDDAHRAVFVARSTDDGVTFERERQASPGEIGACACCGMSSSIDLSSKLHLFYRAAGRSVDRDMTLLTSADHAESFTAMRVHNWSLNACPLTTSALVAVNEGVLAAWETEQQVYFETLIPGRRRLERPIAPSGAAIRRHPAIGRNGKGETLLAWTVGTGWGSGGGVAWQIYDATGTPTSAAGQVEGLPVWGSPAVVVRPDGRFLLWY